MTALVWVAAVLAGGAGAMCRFVVDGLVRARLGARVPWGTMLLNVSGSFFLGLLTGTAAAHSLPDSVTMIVGAGFLGGYTTFSTAALDTVRLAQAERPGAALASAVGVLVAAPLAGALGWWLGAAAAA